MTETEIQEIAEALAVLPSDLEGRHRAVLDVLRWFRFDHLPAGLPRSVSAMMGAVAGEAVTMIEVDDTELTHGLNRLKEAKDCLVRAAIAAGKAAAE